MSAVPLNVDMRGKQDLVVIKKWLQDGDYTSAGRTLGAYLLAHPDDEEAWYLMGSLLMAQDHYAMAMLVFEKLVSSDSGSKRFQNWWNLGLAYGYLGKLEDAEKTYRKGLILHPQQENLMVALGTFYVHEYRSQEAEETLRKAIDLYPHSGMAHSSLGYALLQQRRWGEGWDEYSYGYGKVRWRTERKYSANEPRWDGTKHKSVHLAVHGEQGIGDQLAGLEPMHDAASDCNVVSLEVSPKIRNLVARSFPDLDVYDTLHKQGIEWPNQKTIDCHAGVFHLHQYYRRSESDYTGKPYLIADPERRIQWRALLDSLGPEPKIGIAWTGGSALTERKDRQVDLTTWLPILKQPAHFVNLEYKDRSEDIEALQRRRSITIHDWPWATRTDDYEDTAALVAELDLVITVPTSIVHLAGGLGVPVWCMTHQRPNIHYCGKGDTLAYYGDRVRLFRRQDDEWVKTVNRISKELETWIDARAAA